MTEKRDDTQSVECDRAVPARGPERRPYDTPKLIEYGTVAKLTQAGGNSSTDFGNMMRMACL